MKQILLLLLTALLPSAQGNAQTSYLPVLEDGKVWKCAVVNRDYGIDHQRDTLGYYRVAVDGDTLVGDRTCRKILVQDWATRQFVSSFAAYEENGKVYQVNDGQLDAFFDMGLSLFDTTFFPATPVVVDSVNVGGVQRKRIVMDSGVDHLVTDDLYFTLVEGIGISQDEFVYASHEDGTDVHVGVAPEGTLCCMLECYKDGKLLFTRKDFKAPAVKRYTGKPLLQEGKVWYTRNVHYFIGEKAFQERIAGDSIVDGVAYKKLYEGNRVTGLLREDGGKVLGRNFGWLGNSDEGGSLVYDLSLEKGDTTAIFGHYRLHVNMVDTIKVDGEEYRRLGVGCYSYNPDEPDDYLGLYGGDTQEYWVEGIGSNYGLNPMSGIEWTTSSYMTFDSCKVDGKLLFTYNDFLRIPHADRQWVCGSYRKVENVDTHEPYWIGYNKWTYATLGETELNGKTYQKVYSDKYLFAMREEDGRVLADADSYRAAFPSAVAEYPQNDVGELVLYDYNAQVGDAYLGHANITVVEVGDTVLSDGQSRRVLVLSTGHQLIEGIGCVNVQGALFDYLLHTNAPTDFYDFAVLENYYDAEGHRVYVNTREQAYEKLLAGVKSVAGKSADSTDASAVYDLQGRRMDGRNLPKGIYIQGGKKFVLR